MPDVTPISDEELSDLRELATDDFIPTVSEVRTLIARLDAAEAENDRLRGIETAARELMSIYHGWALNSPVDKLNNALRAPQETEP